MLLVNVQYLKYIAAPCFIQRNSPVLSRIEIGTGTVLAGIAQCYGFKKKSVGIYTINDISGIRGIVSEIII